MAAAGLHSCEQMWSVRPGSSARGLKWISVLCSTRLMRRLTFDEPESRHLRPCPLTPRPLCSTIVPFIASVPTLLTNQDVRRFKGTPHHKSRHCCHYETVWCLVQLQCSSQSRLHESQRFWLETRPRAVPDWTRNDGKYYTSPSNTPQVQVSQQPLFDLPSFW